MLSGAKCNVRGSREQGLHVAPLITQGAETPLVQSEVAPAMTAAPMIPLMTAGTAVEVAEAGAAGDRCLLPRLPVVASCALSVSAGAALPVPVCMSLHVSENLQPLGVLKNQHSTPVLWGAAKGEVVRPLALPLPLPSPLGVLT